MADTKAGETLAAPVFNPAGVDVEWLRWVVHLRFTTFAQRSAKLSSEPLCSVTLSWPLAKALHELLGRAVAAYEAAEGDIALPRSFVDRRSGS